MNRSNGRQVLEHPRGWSPALPGGLLAKRTLGSPLPARRPYGFSA